MSEPTTDTHRPVRILARDRWSRTALVGLLALAGLTVLGTVGIFAGQLSGSDLVALAGAYTTIVGIVAGRQTPPGAST
jgi:hypothetical protein